MGKNFVKVGDIVMEQLLLKIACKSNYSAEASRVATGGLMAKCEKVLNPKTAGFFQKKICFSFFINKEKTNKQKIIIIYI
mgnify:CR=1 FL=1